MNSAPAGTGWDAGWWLAAERRCSPNFNARPDGSTVDLVVLHHISLPPGVFGSDEVASFFENRLDPRGNAELEAIAHLQVSAHFFLRRDGSLQQFVNCDARAWQAGVSCWHGRHVCNDYSIGIEIEGDAVQPFDAAQYAQLDRLLDAIAGRYPIRAVTTHSEIAAGRKVDPGPTFDFSRLGRRWRV